MPPGVPGVGLLRAPLRSGIAGAQSGACSSLGCAPLLAGLTAGNTSPPHPSRIQRAAPDQVTRRFTRGTGAHLPSAALRPFDPPARCATGSRVFVWFAVRRPCWRDWSTRRAVHREIGCQRVGHGSAGPAASVRNSRGYAASARIPPGPLASSLVTGRSASLVAALEYQSGGSILNMPRAEGMGVVFWFGKVKVFSEKRDAPGAPRGRKRTTSTRGAGGGKTKVKVGTVPARSLDARLKPVPVRAGRPRAGGGGAVHNARQLCDTYRGLHAGPGSAARHIIGTM